jgi:hypothetical protein
MKTIVITATGTPNLYDFAFAAGNFRTANAEWGDGKFLEQIMALIEKLMPLIMGCFASKPAFVENVQDLTDWQKFRLYRLALQQARALKGVKIRDHRLVAEAAVDGMLARVQAMNEDQIAACYDELAA